VQDQVGAGRVDVEELAVPGDAVDERTAERGDRRVVGLQAAERSDVDADDGAVAQPLGQVARQRLHLGQLGHGSSVPSGVPKT
jgi:hypothetical protein